jgi:outer membrane protein assembly factor BamB
MVVVSRDGHVNVVDLTNNTLAWTGSFTTLAAVPAAVTPTTICVAGENGELAAFPLAGCGAATCAPTWTATLPGRPTDRPTVDGDVVYVGTPSGVQAFAADGCGAATCTPIWDQPTSAPVTGSPVVHNATVYVGTQDGTLTAYRLP